MVEQLFGSKTRVKLLKLFYSNSNRSFYVREITRKIDEQINSVRRELANLLSIGIITSDTSNNKVYYEVNQKYEYFDPLQQIFGSGVVAKPKRKKKTDATSTDTDTVVEEAVPEQEMPDQLKALGHIEAACLLGQFTRDLTSGVDVLVVGNVNTNALVKYVGELEAQENKELRYTVLSVEEFKYRLQIKDKFISNVLSAKKQVLVDTLGVFGE